MALNFPNNPAVGYIHAEAGKQYRWTGYAWIVVAATETYGPVFISDTPPTNPLCGDIWYESDTGKLFVYYQDIDSKQWVQVGGSSDLNTADFLPLSGGTLSGTVSFGNTLATNLADPIAAQDAATKAYVDNHLPAIVGGVNPSTDSNGNAIQSGDLWYDTVSGRLFVYYDDGDTAQFVDASPEPPFDTATAATNFVQTLTAATDDIAAAAAGIAVGQMYLIPGGTTWNDVRVRIS